MPLSATGAAPAPASAPTEPTRVSAGQAPALASASAHTGTPFRLPARPGGSSVVTREMSCAPSGRVISIVTAPAGRPAAVESAATRSAGANAGAVQPPSIVKLALAVFGAVPLQGVSSALSALVPQVVGFDSTAFEPPWKLSANAVNGT